jgi:hypothetical protein
MVGPANLAFCAACGVSEASTPQRQTHRSDVDQRSLASFVMPQTALHCRSHVKKYHEQNNTTLNCGEMDE